MKREEIEKLLGGYATGTLTEAEREALFAAALDDQQLFETLAREEPLRELLQDPASRGALLATLDEAPEPWYCRKLPVSWIAAATALTVVIFVGYEYWPIRQAPPLTVVATAPMPQPERSPLPTNLRQFVMPEAPRPRVARPALGAAPPPEVAATAAPDAQPSVQALARFQAEAVKPVAPPPEAGVVAGSVRDGTQAGVPGASVTVTNVATDSNVQVRADNRGEFRTPPLQAGEYRVRIEAPGFQEFEQRGIGVRSGEVRQVDAVLALGTAAETVQVATAGAAGAAANSFPPAPSPPAAAAPPPRPLAVARAMAPATPALNGRADANFGLRYSVLKKLPDGQFAAADARQAFDRSDEVVIRVEAADSGYLYVLEREAQNRWRPMITQYLPPFTSFTIPRSGTLRSEGPATKEFFVTFSRLPVNVTQVVRAIPSGSGQPAEGAAGGGTSVVTTAAEPAAQRVGFPITLRYK